MSEAPPDVPTYSHHLSTSTPPADHCSVCEVPESVVFAEGVERLGAATDVVDVTILATKSNTLKNAAGMSAP